MYWEPVFKLSCGIGEQDTCLLPSLLYICCVLWISRGIAFIRRIFHHKPREVYTVKVRKVRLNYSLCSYNSYIIIVVALQKLSSFKSSNCLLLSLQETFACLAIKDNFLNVFVFSSRSFENDSSTIKATGLFLTKKQSKTRALYSQSFIFHGGLIQYCV